MRISIPISFVAHIIGAVFAICSASPLSSDNSFTCPQVDSPLNILPNDGIISVAKTAQSGDLCTLTLLDPVTGVLSPVARSYDGSDWEVTAGPFAEILSPPICSKGICKFVNKPPIHSPLDLSLGSQ